MVRVLSKGLRGLRHEGIVSCDHVASELFVCLQQELVLTMEICYGASDFSGNRTNATGVLYPAHAEPDSILWAIDDLGYSGQPFLIESFPYHS